MKSKLPNISNFHQSWEESQDKLISSLTTQPLVIVLRLSQNDLEESSINGLLLIINKLKELGVRNIEIAWSPHKNWVYIIREVRKNVGSISFGAASVNNLRALDTIKELGFSYAMSPYLDLSLQSKAKELGQLIVPGVLSLTEVQQAICFGFRIIKLFPASILGIKYLKQIQCHVTPAPFVIAAGGMKSIDLNTWLSKSCNAIALGRELIQNNEIDPLLERWLKSKYIKN